MRLNYYQNFRVLLVLCAAFMSAGLYGQTNPCNYSGGVLTTEDGGRVIHICLDDPENLVNIDRSGFAGGQSQWFITTSGGVILDVPAGGPPFDLSAYGERTLAIWSAAYSGTLVDIELGDNVCASSATGCFSLSNAIAVARRSGNDCQVTCEVMAGTISLTDGGAADTTVCADNGDASAISVTLSGDVSGDNATYLVTDSDGVIVDIPSGNGPFDLSGGGDGRSIWFLVYDDGLTGLAIGNTPANFNGCFNLSNPITINRLTGDDCPTPPCEVTGGVLSLVDGGTMIEICADDGDGDPFEVILTDTGSANIVWVITDSDLNITNLPSGPPFDFEGTGGDDAYLYAVSYTGELEDVAIGGNAGDLGGCYELSNSLFVDRQIGDECTEPCEVIGGVLTASNGESEVSICADDDVVDMINVNLDGNQGDNLGWIITDPDLTIVDLPQSPPFSFEGGEAGDRLIWAISYSGEIEGAEIGADAAELQGCFELSSFVTVNRLMGDDCGGSDCEANGGALSLVNGSTEIETCADDGINDAYEVVLQDAVGSNTVWVLLDAALNISALPEGPPFNFEGTGGGNAQLIAISYDGDLEGLEIGTNISELSGCFSYSNSILVDRLVGDECQTCQLAAGTLSFTGGGDEISICADDGVEEVIDFNYDFVDGNSIAWIVTDSEFNILDVPQDPPTSFEGPEVGDRLLYAVNYNGTLDGAIVGGNIDDLSGCFGLSNPLIINRLFGEDCVAVVCDVDGGVLSLVDGGTEIEICADDGDGDPFEVILTDTIGEYLTWAFTDSDLNIFELPAGPPFDFEGTGGGDVYVWAISHDGNSEGLQVGGNLNTIDGCYDTSNSILVERQIGDECTQPCEAIGGVLTLDNGSDQVSICADDDAIDYVNVTLEGNQGQNFAWVITDPDLTITQLPQAPPFTFEGDEAGDRLIWALSYEGDIQGANVGANAANLLGCFELSSFVTVNRLFGADCNNSSCTADGGSIQLEDGTTEDVICSDDGIEDPIDVTITGTSGTNLAWVITDTNLQILALPAAPPFDLEGNEAGECLIWALSYEDGLLGAEVGQNVNDLEGCFDLSNSISIIRLTGEDCLNDCEAIGGLLSLNDGSDQIVVCADDGILEAIDVDLIENEGSFMKWIITDEDLNILEIPGSDTFDFEGDEPGNRFLWNLSYEEGLSGADIGGNLATLMGCYDLSNPITVIRQFGNDCQGAPLVGPETVINELTHSGVLELANALNKSSADLYLSINGNIQPVTDFPAACGSLDGAFNSYVTFDLSELVSPQGGEIALLYGDDLDAPEALISYLIYGTGNGEYLDAAIEQGLWTADYSFGAIEEGLSIQRDHSREFPTYGIATPTECETNNLSVSSEGVTAAEFFSAVPNPFDGTLTLNVEGLRSNNSSVQIFDLTGRLVIQRVLSFRDGSLTLETDALSAGTYVLRLSNEIGVSVQRIVKR